MSLLLQVIALLAATLGFLALALAMDRHHVVVFGRVPGAARRRLLRTGGTLALLVAALACVASWGPARGAIGLWGVLSLGAAAVLLWLRWRAPTRSALG